jgi:hypothetical protein
MYVGVCVIHTRGTQREISRVLKELVQEYTAARDIEPESAIGDLYRQIAPFGGSFRLKTPQG